MEKVKKYYSAIQSSDKVLRHYTKLRSSTAEYYKVRQRYRKSIVVNLKSPRRRRRKAKVLQRNIKHIVVYLKSPCRKREQMFILRLYEANGAKNSGCVA